MSHAGLLRSHLPLQNGAGRHSVNANGQGTIRGRLENVEIHLTNMPTLPLVSMRERSVFEAVRALNRNGVRPTYSEVAHACGLRSRGYVHRIILHLESVGYVTTGTVGERRSICCTAAGMQA